MPPASCVPFSPVLSFFLHQGLQQFRMPLPFVPVVGPEAGAELPVCPAEAACLRLAGDGTRPAGTRGHVGDVVGAELAKEELALLFLGPGGGVVEILAQGGQFLGRGGPGPAFPFVATGDEARSLVRELEWTVVMERRDQAVVFRGQVELVEMVQIVPEARAHDHDAVRIAGANHGEHLWPNLLPLLVRYGLFRLVEDLEDEPVGPVTVTFGDLFPKP